jgi:outer membrane protein assembly factor BamE (lipoprotein component of BamABCDE complex)
MPNHVHETSGNPLSVVAASRSRTARLLKRAGYGVCFALAASMLTACGGTVATNGHIFAADDIQQIREGMSKDQITLALGTPDTTSTAGGDTFYYISTTTEKQMAFMSPQIVDRKIVAIYFDKRNIAQRIAHYGLKDGKVVDFNSRQTPVYGGDEGLIKSLFRNIGHATPGMPGGAGGGGN